jgi:DNA repair protein RecN (Recombination protein N)
MISHLNIHNFAIIERLSLSFSPGLNVLTGETGAGKSIILNAANLILGGRPSPDLIRTGENEMEVEASFHILPESKISSLLSEWGIKPSEEIIIHRIMSKKGPNKAFINGSLASVSMLTTLGPFLMSIAGQYDQRILTQPETHIDLLDEFAGLQRERELALVHFNDIRGMTNERNTLLARRKRDKEKLELLQFQLQEIKAADLKENEDCDLQTERSRLRNAEALCRLSNSAYHEIYGGEHTLVERTSVLQKDLAQMFAMDPSVHHFANRLKAVLLELEDIAFALRDYAQGVVFDPSRLDWLENRLAAIKGLSKKYGEGVGRILTRMQEIQEEIKGLDGDEINIENLDKRLLQTTQALYDTSVELSKRRRIYAEKLAGKMEAELVSLDMKDLVFRVDLDFLSPLEKDTLEYQGAILGSKGIDRVSFLISPNPGEEPRPLSRVASGGELSRILLVLKSILAGKGEVETLVFDEVDAGIGGETSEKVGLKLKELSHIHQVICITHLPQLASFADHHFLVSKSLSEGRTLTQVVNLDMPSRVEEIARMLGGGALKEKARIYAYEMMKRASQRAE